MKMIINGVELLAFIDTGSQVTVIKPSEATRFYQVTRHATKKKLQGVAGVLLSVEAEVDLQYQVTDKADMTHRTIVADISFPGDVLLGMDLLRRLTVCLVLKPNPACAYIILNGYRHDIQFTDHASLGYVSVPSVMETTEDSPVGERAAQPVPSVMETKDDPPVEEREVQQAPLMIGTKEDLPVEERAAQPAPCVQQVPSVIEKKEDPPEEERAVLQRVTPIHVKGNVIVPPRTGRFVEATLGKGAKSFSVAMITGHSKKVMIPSTISNVNHRKTQVWVVNPDMKEQRLTQGTCLGFAEGVEVEDISQFTPAPTATQERPLDERTQEATAEVHVVADICEARDPSRVENQEGKGDEESPMQAECTHMDDIELEVPEFEEDEFDKFYATRDFGYSENDFFVFPDNCAFDEQTNEVPSAKDRCRWQEAVVSAIKAEPLGINAPGMQVDVGHLTAEQQQQVREVLRRFPSLFDGPKTQIGTIPSVQHHIRTTTDVPVCVRQYRLPQSAKAVIKAECETMLAQGVIEPSTSPWLSPVVLVRKKDGSVRFCVDYRSLNRLTIGDSYPLPRIDELIDNLAGKSWFTVLDSRAAYWSIQVAPEDRPKTAFSNG